MTGYDRVGQQGGRSVCCMTGRDTANGKYKHAADRHGNSSTAANQDEHISRGAGNRSMSGAWNTLLNERLLCQTARQQPPAVGQTHDHALPLSFPEVRVVVFQVEDFDPGIAIANIVTFALKF